MGFQRSAAALAAWPAAAHPAHQVFKDARVPGVFTATAPPKDPSRSERSMFSNPGSPPNRDAHSGRVRPRPGRGHPLERRPAMAVVKCPFLLVRKDVVSRLNFLESALRRLVARIDVGMVLPREPTIGLFDGLGRRVASHSQDFVIIAFGHRATESVSYAMFCCTPRIRFRCIGNCTLESARRFKRSGRSERSESGQAARAVTAQSPGPRIAPFQVGDEASDLHHALLVEPRKPLFEASFHATKCGRPEDHAAEDQEWRSDRARQQ